MKARDLLDDVLGIALDAGRRILEVYASPDLGITHKQDASPLTRADLAAHHCIVEALHALTPDLPVLSEEDANIPYATRSAWRRYWLVDPLDGTKEFIQRNGEFTVNIALIDAGDPVLGVVHAPVLDTSYLAAMEAGAFRIQGTRRERLHARRAPERPTLVVSRSHQDAALTAFLAAAPPHEVLSRGSSLKFCQIAEGSADLYPRTGPTSEWDTAAGQCVAEAAGARVLRLPQQTRLRYNEKASLLNPSFAVIGDAGRDWSALLSSIQTSPG